MQTLTAPMNRTDMRYALPTHYTQYMLQIDQTRKMAPPARPRTHMESTRLVRLAVPLQFAPRIVAENSGFAVAPLLVQLVGSIQAVRLALDTLAAPAHKVPAEDTFVEGAVPLAGTALHIQAAAVQLAALHNILVLQAVAHHMVH